MPDRPRPARLPRPADPAGAVPVTPAAVLAVVAVVALTTGPLYRVRTWWSYSDPLADDAWIIAVYAAIAVVAAIAVWRAGRWRSWLPVVAPMAAFAAWLVLTTLWSVDRSVTLRESLTVASSLLVGIAGARWFSLRHLTFVVWAGIQVGLAWSFVAIALDRPGTLSDEERYVGVFFNPNSLGLYAALGALLSALLLADAVQRAGEGRSGLPVVIGGVLLAALLADAWLLRGSRATTPAVAALGAVVVVVLVVVARRTLRLTTDRIVAGIGLLGAGVLAVAWVTRSRWTEAFGKDSDLTGRLDIWSEVLDRAADRPIAGHGYLASWSDDGFVSAVELASGNRVSSAHDSYLEAYLGGGLIGASALLVTVVVAYVVVTRCALRRDDRLGLMPCTVLCFVVLINLGETLIVGNQLVVALLSASAVAASIADPARSASCSNDRPAPITSP